VLLVRIPERGHYGDRFWRLRITAEGTLGNCGAYVHPGSLDRLRGILG
jgi:hypothetical protein